MTTVARPGRPGRRPARQRSSSIPSRSEPTHPNRCPADFRDRHLSDRKVRCDGRGRRLQPSAARAALVQRAVVARPVVGRGERPRLVGPELPVEGHQRARAAWATRTQKPWNSAGERAAGVSLTAMSPPPTRNVWKANPIAGRPSRLA
jgi:hypothetical protein